MQFFPRLKFVPVKKVKNRIFAKLLILLTSADYFKEATARHLQVGHTHEDGGKSTLTLLLPVIVCVGTGAKTTSVSSDADGFLEDWSTSPTNLISDHRHIPAAYVLIQQL